MIIAIISTAKEIMMPCVISFLIIRVTKRNTKCIILSWNLITKFDYSYLYDVGQKYLEIK